MVNSTNSSSILVTGGAGYIGSHVVKLLGERGENIVVLDNLSTGNEEAVLYGTFIKGDTGNQDLVCRILREHNVDTVMHFAAHTIVPESVENPLKYYANNTQNTLNLLRCCNEAGVENFIFSSTAATYGIPADDTKPCSEELPTSPINPYGMSKLMSEQMISDMCQVTKTKHVILRYFNVAGSDPDGKIGQSTENATLLIKVAAEVALGKRDHLKIFGTDYDTPDGTGIRDYIHVTDLASAHLSALDYLRAGGDSTLVNCGYGTGFSVREVIESTSRIYGRPLTVVEEPRRAGDPPSLIAAVDKIHKILDWKPEFNDLDVIVKTALDWEKELIQRKSVA